MKIIRWGAVALGVVASLALAAPAQAHHNQPAVVVDDPGQCGTVAIATSWTGEDHVVANTKLVIQAAGEQHTAAIGEAIVVGPFDTTEATIRWRIWGGGERDYDSPALDSLPELLEHLDAGGDPLDVDAPGVAWHELVVDGCEPEPTEPPVTDPPTTEPPAAECVDVNTADADELTQLMHIDADRAALIVAGRPYAALSDLSRVNGLGGTGERLAELIAGGDGYLPACEIEADETPAPGAAGGVDELPTTSGVTLLPWLLGGGMLLVAAGVAAVMLGRRRIPTS